MFIIIVCLIFSSFYYTIHDTYRPCSLFSPIYDVYRIGLHGSVNFFLPLSYVFQIYLTLTVNKKIILPTMLFPDRGERIYN